MPSSTLQLIQAREPRYVAQVSPSGGIPLNSKEIIDLLIGRAGGDANL